MNWKACAKCGAWLSLGPSNDEPEAVKVEMRAAEIAARAHSPRDIISFAPSAEWYGWLEHMNNNECGLTDPDWEAGWLARCIATHDGNKPQG